MITNGIGVGQEVAEAHVQEGGREDPAEALRLAGLDPVLIELLAGDHDRDLHRPHDRHQREQDLCRVTHRRDRILGRMATTPEQKPSIAPIVGPDDERRFTDSGLEIKHAYRGEDVEPEPRGAARRPGRVPLHARDPSRTCTAAASGRCASTPATRAPRRRTSAYHYLMRPRLDRPVDGVRPPDPARPRLRRPARAWARSADSRRGHRHDRRHAASVRRTSRSTRSPRR